MRTEPVSATPPRSVRFATTRQDWRDVVFVHWEVPVDEVRRRLPRGVVPDLYAGRAFVGLIGLGMRVAALEAVPLPYVGEFPEVNVRLYSVDRAGRRGIVFCSLDAGRLLPTLVARAGYRLPYAWWAGQQRRTGDVITYSGRRRWPGAGPRTRFAVRTGGPVDRPTDLDHFLTARWTLHWSWFGRSAWCAAEHRPWPLHHADLVECDDELVSAAGLPQPIGPPISVLWSPGVTSRIGMPRPL